MEEIEPAACRGQGGVRRFYKRVGATVAIAYLLEAVDCHRDNMIAYGEWPILIDLETLSHPPPRAKNRRIADRLHRTGFFRLDLRKGEFQPESSALGKSNGDHKPTIGGRAKHAVDYDTEIVQGFECMWHRILGCKRQRAAFVLRLRSIRRQSLRRIYRTTNSYDAIRSASIQPPALRSLKMRDLILLKMLERKTVTKVILEAEIYALKRLDIPRFNQRPPLCQVPRRGSSPEHISTEILHALRS
jgi:lantibiotic modifying enzyme